ncbi:MAG: alginate lyase family protein [Candidatus Kapabacteria bacterium]|nr:alginate lyase family protein [Ignavibacteriota bacterium]MCW5885741.1 alginate lyase family protein [Candidatus Kapabacteria bacterium]
MLKIIKSKGIRFFLKRVTDKLINRFISWQQHSLAVKSLTYSNYDFDINGNYNLYLSNDLSLDFIIKDRILNIADSIMLHKFNLLGSGLQDVTYNSDTKGFENINYNHKIRFSDYNQLLKICVSEKNYHYSKLVLDKIDVDYKLIDWQRDFKSGFRWDSNYYHKKITYGNIEGADIKVPWELGRLSHLIMLFYVYNLTGEDKYFNEYKNQILDFIAFNPPLYGVQWMSAMDVALRAVNITSTYSLFQSSGAKFDDDFKKVLFNYLNDHLIFIISNLEWSSGMRANHYYTNICGLTYLSIFLPLSEQTQFAFNFAVNELFIETDYQFYADGGNFEASLPYHNFAAEMLFHSLLLLKNSDKKRMEQLKYENIDEYKNHSKKNNLHKDLRERISTKHFLAISENCRIEQPEIFSNKVKKIAEFTLSTLAPDSRDYLIGDNDDGFFFRLIPKYGSAGQILVSDRTELEKLSLYFYGERFNRITSFFSNFGVYIYRFELYEMAVRCGSLGQHGKGGHAHNDQLSFELYSGSDLLICDSGTFTYTASPELRNKFRSTKNHNTLSIEGLEQNHIPKGRGGDLFWLEDKSKSEVLRLSDNEFSGRHLAYEKPHERILTFKNNEIIGCDICEISSFKRVSFHLSPQVEILNKSETTVFMKTGATLFEIESVINNLKVENYQYSPSYGMKYSSNVIVIESKHNEIFWKIKIRNAI